MIWLKEVLMSKKRYWKLEYSIALFVMLGVILLLMPVSIESTRQANAISKWNEKLNRVEYMFSVINAHITDDILKSMNKAKTPQEREAILLALVKPYLRINTENYPSKHYKPRYMNGAKVYKGQSYYFDDFYFAENNSIVGIKDIKSENSTDALFIMMFDINGIMPPNRWGRDIYGVNIYDGGKIEPFGFDMEMNELKKDCSDSGTGVSCSYYYKIGGGFDE
ncbi:TPA: hypothetical protein CPT81_01740 [Candidatus Gastranaerophilales bacterium HUM_20]|nr:MAG TPA: hypothetical protein CPT81_01740 [Candidatus Gastranaerophilales bacterium HUM_20]